MFRLQVIQQLLNNDELSEKLLHIPLKSFVETLSAMAASASGALLSLTVELVSLPPPDNNDKEQLAFATFAGNYISAYTQYVGAGTGRECAEVLLSERLDFVLQSDPFAAAKLVAATEEPVGEAAPPPPAPAPAAASDAGGRALQASKPSAVALETYTPSDVLVVLARRNGPLLDTLQEHGLMLYCFGSAPPNDIDAGEHTAALNNKFWSV